MGRLAGALGLVIAAVALGPKLLRPPQPEPLPADVGLSTGATGAQAAWADEGPRRASRRPQPPRPEPEAEAEGPVGQRPKRADRGSPKPEKPKRERQRHDPPRGDVAEVAAPPPAPSPAPIAGGGATPPVEAPEPPEPEVPEPPAGSEQQFGFGVPVGR